MDVRVIETTSSDAGLVGWDGPGWYFTDYVGSLHGPFATRGEAEALLKTYIGVPSTAVAASVKVTEETDAKGTIHMIRDLGRFTLFSTVVLQPSLLGHPERQDAEEKCNSYRFGYAEDGLSVAAFGHSIGHRLPGTRWVATRVDTNMMVAAQVVDEGLRVRGLSWRIPARTPHEFQIDQNALSYGVTLDDIREFVGSAKMAFFSGGDKPFYELPLAARPVVFDAEDAQHPEEDNESVRMDAIGSWGQKLTEVDPPLPICRLEKFWWKIQFADRLPDLKGPLTVICAIETQRTRGVN